MTLYICIAIYLLVLHQTCAEFTSHFSCTSSYSCDNDLLLCPTSSNCSVECSGDYSCYYAAINGYNAQSLYLDVGDSEYGASLAPIYCRELQLIVQHNQVLNACVFMQPLIAGTLTLLKLIVVQVQLNIRNVKVLNFT